MAGNIVCRFFGRRLCCMACKQRKNDDLDEQFAGNWLLMQKVTGY